MRTSLLNYAETVSPLHNLLESFYKRAGGRTKFKLRHIALIRHGERNTPPHLRR
jgi:hypothetical protein